MLHISKKVLQSELFKFLLGVVLMLVVSGLLAFNALLLWVATGPRTLDNVTPYIEDALSASDGSYRVKIGQTNLIWDGWRHPVDIRLKDISVLTNNGKRITAFPEIALGVDVLYLPLGRIMPTSLTINSPRMNLIRNDDRSFYFGFKQETVENAETTSETVPFAKIIAPFISQNDSSNFRRLRNIIIRDASLIVSNSNREVFFDAKDFNLFLNKNRKGEIKITNSTNINYTDHKTNRDFNTAINSEFALKPLGETLDGTIEFSEIMPDVLADLFSNHPQARAFAVPISGNVSLSINKNGIFDYIGFEVKGSKGSITSNQFIEPLIVNSLYINGAVGSDFSKVSFDELNADIDGVKLSGKASAELFDTSVEPDASPEIRADITLSDIPAEKIKYLWPPSLSPMTRQWVTENISEGKIIENKVNINIQKGDLSKAVLPKESIDANITAEGLKIRYLPEHPPISNVKSKIHIDGVSLKAEIESADFLEKTKITSGSLVIDDLNVDNPYLTVHVMAESPAKDMVHFLALPRLEHASHLNLQENTVTGNVKGEAKIGFNFFAPEGKTAEEAITYDIKAEVSNISQKDFLKKFDIVGANGNITVNNQSLEFIGTGEVNGAKVSKGNFKYLFEPENGVDTLMELSATTSVENLKRFGYPDFPFLKGNLAVDAKVKLGEHIEQNEASINLEQAEINFSKFLSWVKPIGEAVKLDIATDKKDGILNINSFSFKGDKASGKGSATLSKDMADFSAIKLDGLKLGENDIESLNYQINDNGMNIDVKAKSFDMTSHLEKNNDGFSFQNFPAMLLKAEINKLILAKDKIISGFTGTLNCDKILCRSANMTGTTGEGKPFTIKIFSDSKKQRQISVKSDDAGSFLYSFGVLDGMSGGTLNLTGNYQESSTGSILKAKIDVSEHTRKNAPVLGKLLSLTSLTGMIDTLQGNGINFKLLTIPFTLANDVITIEKGKTYGSAIGLTIDGTITFPKKNIDFQGTVVPSYTLNNFFGNIPLLGDMLTGGEGQGVFAARYAIKGLSEKPEVSVNPLSILTPGFLRGLFDIFDEKEIKKPDGKKAKPAYPQ